MIKEIIIALALQDEFCVETYKNLSYGAKPSLENRVVCSLLINEAKRQNIKPIRALSVGWVESGLTFKNKPNSSNCVGPLQIKVKYWCKGKHYSKCDHITNGVRALKYMINNFKPIRRAYCYYNDSRKPECKTDFMSDYVIKIVKSYGIIKKSATKLKYTSLVIMERLNKTSNNL